MIISDRLSVLLSEIVDEYIKSATPIASTVMSNRLERSRSPASIRSDLRHLEELGFLHQVHAASGGRIPTEMAYERYIQNLPDDPTFVTDLIKDLKMLQLLISRIEQKLSGFGTMPRLQEKGSDRKYNFQKLFEDPDLQMSAIYLIIKEKLDNGKMQM